MENKPEKKNMLRRSIARLLTVCMLMSLCFMMVPTAFAAEAPAPEGSAAAGIDNVFIDMISDMSNQIYRTMRAIAIPVVCCFVGYAGFCALTGGQKGVEQCVSILKRCLIAVCFIAFAPLIGQQLGNWVKGSGGGDLSDYNSLITYIFPIK